MTVPKMFRGSLPSTQRRIYSCSIPMLQPGERTELRITPPAPFLVDRIVFSLRAMAPDIRFYQRRVGGSKRRGRLASIRWACEMISHDPHRANLSIDNITIDEFAAGLAIDGEQPTTQFRRTSLLASPVPAAVFAPDAVHTGPLRLPPITPLLVFYVTNREFSRVTGGSMACMGRDL